MNAVLHIAPRRHPISSDEYLRMGEAGVFAPSARLELIEGEIIEMAPIGSPHAGAVNVLTRLLLQCAGAHAVVAVQNPLVLDGHSVPQPDLALLKPRADDYASAHPNATDAYLLIEVSDRSRDFDLTDKAALYARAGVVELWVVDVNERRIHVLREPGADGYRDIVIATGEQRIACQALPAVELAVREVFPAPAIDLPPH